MRLAPANTNTQQTQTHSKHKYTASTVACSLERTGIVTLVAASTDSTEDLKTRVLAFEAPYLELRFMQYGLAEDRAGAGALFLELKKYLFLAACAKASMPMMSALVDAAWHQFILFTEEYRDFCERELGSFQHHGPRVEEGATTDEPPLSIATFVDAYRSHFGPPPDVWHNERCLKLETRVARPHDTRFTVQVEDAVVTLLRHRSSSQVVCRASTRARPALEFIAANPIFLVRELPGLKSGAEQLGLIEPLVEHDILRLAF